MIITDYKIEGGTATLLLQGEIDHHTLRTISGEVNGIIDTYLPATLVLDMRGIRFMDSSGLALVIGGSHKMSQYGGRVVVRNVPKQPLKVLRTAGVGRFVTLEERDEKV